MVYTETIVCSRSSNSYYFCILQFQVLFTELKFYKKKKNNMTNLFIVIKI